MHLLAPFTTTDDGYTVYPSEPYTDPSMTGAEIGFLFLVMAGVFIVSYVISSWLLSRMFERAGVESWKAWVPVYNSYVMLEMGGQSGWWALAMCIPFLNIVAVVFFMLAVHQINENFGKGGGMTVLYFFVPIAWMIIMAFDNSKWRGPRLAGVRR